MGEYVMKRIEIDHFKNYEFLSRVKMNDCGEVAFISKRASIEDNKYYSDLYLLKGEKPVRLTSCGNISNYYWLEEDIIFPNIRSDKDKELVKNRVPITVFQKLSLNGGEATELLRVNRIVIDTKFLSEDEFVFTSIYNPVLEKVLEESKGNMEEALKKLQEEKDYVVIDELPFWQNGVGFTNKCRVRLYHYKKGEIKAITDEFTTVTEFKQVCNTRKFIFVAKSYESKMEISNSMYLYDLDTKEVENISYEEDFGHNSFKIINEDTMILQGSDKKKYGVFENGNFYLYNFITKEKEVIDESYNYSGYNSVGSDIKMGNPFVLEGYYNNEDKFYFLDTVDDSAHIMECNLKTKNISKLTKLKGMVQEFIEYSNGFLAIAMRGNDGSEFYEIDFDGNEKLVTNINTHITKEYEISTPEELTFINEVGDEVKGWIMKPIGCNENEKYPVLLNIHGGPKTVFGANFFHEMQYWASEGYGVIYCNPTGSDGKGNDFADIRGKYGTVDYNDIMTFVDKCIEKASWIDVDKLGVTGGSYGGFMTNWIIGHTDRFKAAASQRSISNWISKSNTTDIGYFFSEDQMGVTAWSDHEKMWWHSPLKYADKVTTPTLFIHSDEDYRCWLAEGIQMYYALKYFGVEARMCIFKGENHELSRSGLPKHRVRRIKEITEWFNKHLKA